MDTKQSVIKKTLVAVFFICVGVGLTIAYVFFKKPNYSFVPAEKSSLGFLYKRISSGLADSMMTEYYSEQEGIWLPSFRLRTELESGEVKTLRGFWLDAKMFEEIQQAVRDANPNDVINGYHIYFGKHKGKKARYYSLIVRASKQDSVKRKNIYVLTNSGVGPYYDFVDPCPDNCGEQGLSVKK